MRITRAPARDLAWSAPCRIAKSPAFVARRHVRLPNFGPTALGSDDSSRCFRGFLISDVIDQKVISGLGKAGRDPASDAPAGAGTVGKPDSFAARIAVLDYSAVR
jgi:hypothetical protein